MVNYYMLITWLDIVLTISNQVAITGFGRLMEQANPCQLWALDGLKDKQMHVNRGFLVG
ncbi:hypothetical protein [Prevotella histicola]